MSPETAQNHFQTAVILRDPRIERTILRANQLQSELKHLVPDIYIEDTHRDIFDYRLMINEYNTDSDTLWIPMGGDGTHSDFSNALFKNDDTESPVMFFPAGNANDIAKSLASFNINEYPEALVKYGDIAKLIPLEVSSTDNKHLLEYAIGYFGLGYSGEVALELERQDYRNERDNKTLFGKILSDGELISNKLQDAPGIIVYEDGKPRLAYELLYSNGRRMARGIRFRNGSLIKPGAIRAELDRPDHIGFAKVVARAAILGNLQFLGHSDQHKFSIHSYKGDCPIRGQRDGQPIEYASGTKLEVKTSARNLNVLTGKL